MIRLQPPYLERPPLVLAAQVEPLPDGLRRELFLLDAPGAEPRRTTVAEVLLQEAQHAREHLVRANA